MADLHESLALKKKVRELQEKLETEKQEIQNRDDLILKLKNTSLKTHGSPQKVLKDYNSKVGKNINSIAEVEAKPQV